MFDFLNHPVMHAKKNYYSQIKYLQDWKIMTFKFVWLC